jgi:spectinomycin phosphotransferase
VRTPPSDLDGSEVAVAVANHWSIVAATIEYVPLGFGSHHWLLTDASGQRWFVTADAVAESAERLAELSGALATAHALRHRCSLDFVVAPVAGVSDQLLAITGRYAVALYPYLERITHAPAEAQQMLGMVIALHAATEEVRDLATVDDLTIRDRSSLEAALDPSKTVPDAGPFAAEFAALVQEHRLPILAALDRHDVDADTLQTPRAAWVVTHGEPKPNNTMITVAGPALVDWDTVQLAPPARDLWMLDSVADYIARTERTVPADDLAFYRRRWDLKDLCGSAAWFTQPHQRTTDTEMAWQGSINICCQLRDSHRPH